VQQLAVDMMLWITVWASWALPSNNSLLLHSCVLKFVA
jgi:hypothetical protein